MRFMRAFLLFSSLAFAQTATKPPATPPPQAPIAATAEKRADVASTAAVVTVNGFCPGKQAADPDCKLEVTRAEIERLAKAVGAPEAQMRQLASSYAQMMVMSKLAEERGIDKKPETEEILRAQKMQVLSQLLGRDIREEAAKVPAADIEKYYNEHAAQYEQATLQRVIIPKSPPNPLEKVDEATVRAEGAKISAAAKEANADFAKLQKQAYEDLKLTATPPPTELKDVRRDTIPLSQAKAFDAKPGEVTEPIDDTGGIYIYKVVSKKKLTEPEVEQDIKRTLEQERAQAAMQQLVGNIKLDYNEAYFGGPARPAAPRLESPPTQTPRSSAPASKAPAAAPKSSAAPKTPK